MRGIDTSLGVVRYSLLEEVGLALKRDHIHEVEGVGNVVDLGATEGDQETISDELDVLVHQNRVHANEGARQSI